MFLFLTDVQEVKMETLLWITGENEDGEFLLDMFY